MIITIYYLLIQSQQISKAHHRAWGEGNVWMSLASSASGPLVTKWTDVLPQDLVKSRSRKIQVYTFLKFDRHIGNSAMVENSCTSHIIQVHEIPLCNAFTWMVRATIQGILITILKLFKHKYQRRGMVKVNLGDDIATINTTHDKDNCILALQGRVLNLVKPITAAPTKYKIWHGKYGIIS